MFCQHQPVIGEFARSSPDGMARVYQFVLSTVQQALWMTPDIMEDIDRAGIESKYLWGFKYDAYEFITDNKDTVYRIAMANWDGYADPEVREREVLRYFSGLPGLGIIKGGFMAQLCFGVAGCLDTHNLSMYGIEPSRFKSSRYKSLKPNSQTKMLHDYLTVIDSEGGCQALWDTWCQYVADRQPDRYVDAYHVSRLHVEAIGA